MNWRLTLPDGRVLYFEDWEEARIEATWRSGPGLILIPEKVSEPPKDRQQGNVGQKGDEGRMGEILRASPSPYATIVALVRVSSPR